MKITNILLVLLLMTATAFAQNENRPPQRGNLNAANSSCTPSNAASTVSLTLGPNDAGASIQTSGTFGATISFAVTADGTNWLAATGSPVTAGPGVTSTTTVGIWQVNTAGMAGVCAFLSSFTSGLAQVTVKSSQGTPDDSSVSVVIPTGGLIVTVSGSSGATSFSTGVMGSAIAVGVTTVAPFGTTTTLVQGLAVNNICSTAVQVTVADGNNQPMIGSETSSGGSFSIPAQSSLTLNMGIVGHVFTGGLKTSAVGTNNCILEWMEGKQSFLPIGPFLLWAWGLIVPLRRKLQPHLRLACLIVVLVLLAVCGARAQDSSPAKINAISAQSFAGGVRSQSDYIAELENDKKALETQVKSLQAEVDRLTAENKSLKETQ